MCIYIYMYVVKFHAAIALRQCELLSGAGHMPTWLLATYVNTGLSRERIGPKCATDHE